MREILFKAKRIDNGKWIFGGYWLNDTVTRATHKIIDNNGDAHSVDPATICQYTGLFDQNNARIFEGDIIEAGYYKWKCQVVWDEACARFICYTIEGERRLAYVDMVDKNNKSAVEVVGNIFNGTNKDSFDDFERK